MMIFLADLMNRYRNELVHTHGHELLASHHHALNCIQSCRNQHSAVMLLECGDSHHSVTLPHSCGHLNCANCSGDINERHTICCLKQPGRPSHRSPGGIRASKEEWKPMRCCIPIAARWTIIPMCI